MPEIAYRTTGTRAAILGLGAHVPEDRLTNDDLARIVDTSDAWIRQRTGIAERRIVTPGVTTAEIALPAARRALLAAEVLPAELDLVVLGTSSPDQQFPATACHLQRMLGAERAMAVDALAACSSWLYAASIAERYIATGVVRRALVVGAEVMSRLIDYTDRTSCILFGDGAGAAVLGPSATAGFDSFVLGADGAKADLIYCGPTADDPRSRLRMDGQGTYRAATRAMEEASLRACEVAGVSPQDVALVVPHQANARIIDAVASRLGIPLERFALNLDRYGNTSSASIPLALDEAVQAGRVAPGDRVLLVGFGAGLTWAATVMTWGA
ncbi:MAG TPA: beta-ketoacyl-ACP synthase III [Candidatus Dormibacteraeota bacterium]|jgi:3-oxoacyl-[acyl-carrier-protein] synthase-3|nr:beta-ketoacyl-ACP synthase III [Candidatus Dormibacteraeota bacterium]